jgi:uncharacterized protein (TIGR02611 family)
VASVRAVLRFLGRNGRRAAIAVAGFALLAIGAVMLVTPGPGLVAIVAGLAVLATEFAWAERALDRARRKARQAASRVRRGRRPPGSVDPESGGADPDQG